MSQYQPDPTRDLQSDLPDPTAPAGAGWTQSEGSFTSQGSSMAQPPAGPAPGQPAAESPGWSSQPVAPQSEWTSQSIPPQPAGTPSWDPATGNPAASATAPNPYGYQVASEEDRNLAVATHLSAFPAAMIVISPLGPLTAYLLSANRPFVRANAVEALNFNLTMWIGVMVSFVLMFLGIGFITLPLFGLAMLAFHIVAALKARDGVVYRYPMSFRFFS